MTRELPTLKQAGFTSGDFIPLVDSGGGTFGSSTTSSSTYSVANENVASIVQFDNEFPSGAETYPLYLYFTVTALNGTTVDVRVQNTTDGETVVESTGISSVGTPQQISTSNYEPTTTSDAILLTTQIRSGDGSNTVGIAAGRLVWGVEIP